jgi:hypothetical protein
MSDREKLIEAMAQALFDGVLWQGAWEKANDVERGRARWDATAVLAAIETMGAVVVPAEPTDEMRRAGVWALDKARERDGLLQEPRPYAAQQKHAIRYAAMIAASPYKRSAADADQ